MKSIFFTIFISIFLTNFVSQISYGQNLMTERIRKITGRKKSIYFKNGIFHNGAARMKSKLKAVRHSFTTRLGYERIVFDFDTKDVPQIYGNISSKDKKLYLDFFKTSLINNIGSFGVSKYVKNLNFFNIGKDSLSLELVFKNNINMDIFSLKNPGRLVVDIKI